MNKHRTKSIEQRAKSKEHRVLYKKSSLFTLRFLFYAICFLLLSISSMLFAYFASARGIELKEKIPDLCYRCHKEIKERLSDTNLHFPFKEGKCTLCHNTHAGRFDGLIKEDINSLCLGCHEGIKKAMKKNFVHRPLRSGVCTDCHLVHGGKNRKLLIVSEKDLCWKCHESLKAHLSNSSVHIPFKEGNCSSCHEPHASTQENLMDSSAIALCVKCHSPRCKSGDISITFTTQNMDCISCHSGHSSNFSGLLGPYGHSDFLERNCDKCHNSFLPDTKITTKLTGKALCLNCHKKDTITLKLDDIHLDESKGGCTICHNYHASKKKNLTVRESQICIKCHEDTEKRTLLMEKTLRSIRCVPVKERRCFECHIPSHSLNSYYFKKDEVLTCAQCHEAQHKVTHPLGPDVKDPRNDQPITCKTCHSMHSARADFMLYFDRKKQLCIQCHKK